ncbi:ABC transporter permease subunit [Streptomyces sp. DSM 44917]|uniref:ABC transporter permease subunit n=1 Tax=Streptomyces boetiae TaxID=3075541 RepID=A0ABU2LBJ2_9ACTN|nr:ABC transporter permease subunit [Streptomyces sp. DSM 44917]MDT0308924.1 ABC transporter permease subunit [Streptomyces sp. DSM 44917]
MSGQEAYRSQLAEGRAGFGRLLLAEWTKLRSVPRWAVAAAGAVVLSLALALLVGSGRSAEQAGGGGGEAPEAVRPGLGQEYQDGGFFRYAPLPGDGEVRARVTAQRAEHEEAKAGLMIRADERPGSPYAALVVTPGGNVRLQAEFGGTDLAGGDGPLPRWLRLVRTGETVTGYQSADGENWRRVGEVRVEGLTGAAHAGVLVASPDLTEVERQFGSESVSGQTGSATATFDHVALTGGAADSANGGQDPIADGRTRGEGEGTPGPGGSFTATGYGDIGRYPYGDDLTQAALTGVLALLAAVVALGVLFLTSEFRRGMIRTTFAVTPRRGRVLAAKAVVLGGAAGLAGVVTGAGTFLLAAPRLAGSGVPAPELTEGPALRAVLGTGLLLAAVALLSLGVAAVVRGSAAAISLVLVLVLLPQIVATGLPLSAALWLERVTPAAGFAIQETVRRYDTAIAPWAGLAVLCGYAALALAAGWWRLRRRDA